MKRYRIFTFDFDTRATMLRQVIEPHWEEQVREVWAKNHADIRAGLIQEFGAVSSDAKIKNFIDLGPRPFSVLAFHNRFAAQVRHSFVIGGYYPALIGACALGERILNHLVLGLRESYRTTPEYKAVHRKDSLDNWTLAIRTLTSWGVLTEDAAEAFGKLEEVRNRAVHFSPETDRNDRPLALEAISLLDKAIQAQFAMMGLQPWFIPDTAGECFLKKSWETHPFIQLVYIPNALLVGPEHKVLTVIPEFRVQDRPDYPETDISDEEFVRLRYATRDSENASTPPEA